MIDLSSVFNFFIIENLGVDDKDLFEGDDPSCGCPL